MLDGTCLHCGAEFTQVGRGRPRSWCYDCLPAHDGTSAYRVRAADLHSFKKSGEHGACCGRKRCLTCHKAYEPWCTWEHPGSAGSAGSAGIRCKPCYLAYTREAQRRRNNHKARAERIPKALGSRRSREYKAECQQAELPCALCGDPIDYALPHPHRLSFSVDHIVPTAQGGAMLDRANLQPSHLSCNARKGRQQQDDEPVLIARAALWIASRLETSQHERTPARL